MSGRRTARPARRRAALQRLGRWSLAGLAVVGALSACRSEPTAPRFKAIDVAGSEWGRAWALPDTAGQLRQLSDWQGKVVLLFFGFTQCPDVCPTTLATLSAVMRQLGAEADQVQVLFVTLDPQRDRPDVLAQYVTAFDARFLALRGDAEQTAQVAREFKVFYQKVAGTTAESYNLDHTAASYVFDPRGRLRLYIRHGSPAEDIAADLRLLLAGR